MAESPSIIDIFLGNFLKYDFIIFVLAVATAFCYIFSRREANKLYNKMHLTLHLPTAGVSGQAVQDYLALHEAEVVAMRKKAGSLYTIFSTLTGIFTLLGILGTVISLIPMVADMDSAKMNFFLALTSTFWGLVFAILFKVLDGFIAARIEDNEKTVALYLERNARSVGGQP